MIVMGICLDDLPRTLMDLIVYTYLQYSFSNIYIIHHFFMLSMKLCQYHRYYPYHLRQQIDLPSIYVFFLDSSEDVICCWVFNPSISSICWRIYECAILKNIIQSSVIYLLYWSCFLAASSIYEIEFLYKVKRKQTEADRQT
jgi:hypothetical protein